MQHWRTSRSVVTVVGCWLALVVTAPAQEKENDAIKPVPRDGNWMQRHESFNERVKQGKVDLLLIGDSITQGWESDGKNVWAKFYGPRKAVNMGIGGDRTQHVLWRLQNGELDGYTPKAFVIMIGTNNMSANTEVEISEGVKAIVEEIHKKHAKAKILLLGIFPRHADAKNPIREKVKKTNDLIAKFDDGKTVKYLDIGAKFLEPDGSLSKEVMPDALHLSKKGYGIWADAIQKDLDGLLK